MLTSGVIMASETKTKNEGAPNGVAKPGKESTPALERYYGAVAAYYAAATEAEKVAANALLEAFESLKSPKFTNEGAKGVAELLKSAKEVIANIDMFEKKRSVFEKKKAANAFRIGNFGVAAEIYDLAGETTKAALAWTAQGDKLYYFAGSDAKKLEEAIVAYGIAIAADPSYAKPWCGTGYVFCALRDYWAAVGAFNKANDLDPDCVEAWLGKGDAYTHLAELPDSKDSITSRILTTVDKHKEALHAFRSALRINPKHEIAWNDLGHAFGAIHEYARALSAYNQAVQIDPEFAIAWYNKGCMHDALGQGTEATAAYTRALEINPNYAKARERIESALVPLPSAPDTAAVDATKKPLVALRTGTENAKPVRQVVNQAKAAKLETPAEPAVDVAEFRNRLVSAKIPESIIEREVKAIERIQNARFLHPDGKPLKEWKIFYGNTWGAAWKAALAAASGAKLNAKCGDMCDVARAAAIKAERDIAWRATSVAMQNAANYAFNNAVQAIAGSEKLAKHHIEFADHAALRAAYDAQFMGGLILASDLPLWVVARGTHRIVPFSADNKSYLALAAAHMKVWMKGYALVGDVDGVMYVCAIKSEAPKQKLGPLLRSKE